MSQIRTEARAAADEVQRRLVADAVCEIVASEGLEAATLRRTASALDCTTGLISHYFQSKEELLIEALQHATRQLSLSIGAELGDGRPPTIDEHLQLFCNALPLTPARMPYWRVLAAFRSAALTNTRLGEHFACYDEKRSAHQRDLLAQQVDRSPNDESVVRLDQALNAMLEGFGLVATERPDLYTSDTVYRTLTVALQAWIADITP